MIIFMVNKTKFQNYYSQLKYSDTNILDYVLENVNGTSITYPMSLEERKIIEKNRVFINNLIKINKLNDIKELYIQQEKIANNKQELLSQYYFVPWFYFYSEYKDLKENFFNYITSNEEYFKSLGIEIRNSYFISICEKTLSTYANPILGKIPLSDFNEVVIKEFSEYNKDISINKSAQKWFEFFNNHNMNSYNKFYEKFRSAYEEIVNINIIRKNKAEYTICYISEKEVFNDLISKIIAKFKGNSLAQKKLAYLLAIDEKESLFNSQLHLINCYLKYFSQKKYPINYKQIFKDYDDTSISELTQKIQQEEIKLLEKYENFKNNSRIPAKIKAEVYLSYVYKKLEHNYICSDKIRFYFLIKFYNSSEYFKYFYKKYEKNFSVCGIREFYQFVLFFLHYQDLCKEKILNENLEEMIKFFPLVTMGAIILNDIRRCLHTFNNSNKIQHPESKYTRVITADGITNVIDRDNSKYNMIGKASYNVRNYEISYRKFDSTSNSQLQKMSENVTDEINDLEKVRQRNRYLNDRGMELGNGISGHIDAIQKVFLEVAILDTDKTNIIATINCSMFLFWSLFYDKTSTAVHSYIEVFESSSSRKNNILSKYYQLDVSDVFSYILNLYTKNEFDAIDFLEYIKNSPNFINLTKIELAKKLRKI